MLKHSVNKVQYSTQEPIEREDPIVKTQGTNKKVVLVLILLLAIAIGGFAWSYNNYSKYKNKVARLSTPEGQQELVKAEIDDLVAKVAKLIVLPTDETPTVATVLDSAGLSKDQPFYKDAENGDKVIIYVKAQKAIIYSPSRNVLVNVGPVYIENNGAASNSATQEAPKNSRTTPSSTSTQD